MQTRICHLHKPGTDSSLPDPVAIASTLDEQGRFHLPAQCRAYPVHCYSKLLEGVNELEFTRVGSMSLTIGMLRKSDHWSKRRPCARS